MVVATRAPDLYITGDGRHVAIRDERGQLAMLRSRGGDFIRDMIRENAGVEGDLQALDARPDAACNADSCVVSLRRGKRDWRILATRSRHHIPLLALAAACRRADIVVSERWLPQACQPRWLKIDRALLSQVGGMTIDLENQRIATARNRTGDHRWTRYRSGTGGVGPPHRDDRNVASRLE